RRTIDAIARERILIRERRAQRGQFVRRGRDQVDLGVHRLIEGRIQVDLAQAQRPSRGRPQKGWGQQARQQHQATHRREHFYSQESGGQAGKVHCAIGACNRILTCPLHKPITISYWGLFTKIWATETALCAAHFRTLSATTQKFRALSRVKCARNRPTYTLSGCKANVAGVGNSSADSASMTESPVPHCSTRAASATRTGR